MMALCLLLELILQNLVFGSWTAPKKFLFAWQQLLPGESNKQQLLQKSEPFPFLFPRNNQKFSICKDKHKKTKGVKEKTRPHKKHFYLSFLLPTDHRKKDKQIWDKRRTMSPWMCWVFFVFFFNDSLDWMKKLPARKKGSGLEGSSQSALVPAETGCGDHICLLLPQLQGRDGWEVTPTQSYLH